MEIQAFAEQILFSAELKDKIWAPESFTDEEPGTGIDVPKTPGRPGSIPLLSDHPIPPAPTPAALSAEHARGLALHTFAHHELQAFELMALALLRWPQAPAGFRRSLAHIIRDEQRHFQLYKSRAEHWGVALGDVGVGHFFWNTVAHLESPLAFLAAMSLTFEQANLDFAVYWKAAFAAVEDQDSVDILHTVYEDEIRHVRHGLIWFERMKCGLDLQRFEEELAFPLSAGRAKGPLFNREGRLQAGLPEHFVDALEIRNVSRGRPPRIFLFNPSAEEEVAGRSPKQAALDLAADLTTLPMFLAHKEDVVLAKAPSTDFLLPLHRAGFAIPQFAENRAALGDRELGALQPWGWSPRIAKQLGASWPAELGRLYDKTWAFEQRERFLRAHTDPFLLRDEAAVLQDKDAVLERISRGGNWVLKRPFSTSGQGRIRLRAPVEAQGERWIERQLKTGPLLVEPWQDRVADFSVQTEIHKDRIQILGKGRFWTAPSGAYRGALLGPWTLGLDPGTIRVLQEAQVGKRLDQAALQVARAAQDQGYRGPLGVDAMVVRTADGLRLQPILEVNPRYTMGRIALGLNKRLRGQGAWFFLGIDQAKLAGFDGLGDLGHALCSMERSVEASGLLRGFWATNDPKRAVNSLTILGVHKHLEGLRDQWMGLGLDWPEP
jgi:uncharacterized ferritin-like protein (DUF455 family)